MPHLVWLYDHWPKTRYYQFTVALILLPASIVLVCRIVQIALLWGKENAKRIPLASDTIRQGARSLTLTRRLGIHLELLFFFLTICRTRHPHSLRNPNSFATIDFFVLFCEFKFRSIDCLAYIVFCLVILLE